MLTFCYAIFLNFILKRLYATIKHTDVSTNRWYSRRPSTSFSFLKLRDPLTNPRSVEYARNILKVRSIVQKPVYSIVFRICTRPLPAAAVVTATGGTDARPTPNRPIYPGDTYIFSLPVREQLTLCSRLSIGPRAFGGPRFAQNAITTVPRVRIFSSQLALGEAVCAE